jgi:DNA-binding response OmpR family regulator
MTTSTANRTPKALLLDDDTTVLRLVGTALEARGFEVRAATDGETGLSLLLDELLALDVVLVDADLPGRDARAFLHLLRWAGGERELGVVVLSGALDDAAKDVLLALGADAVVDRRGGHAAALEAIVAATRRERTPARRLAEAARPALRGALLLARPRISSAPLRGAWEGARAALSPACLVPAPA